MDYTIDLNLNGIRLSRKKINNVLLFDTIRDKIMINETKSIKNKSKNKDNVINEKITHIPQIGEHNIFLNNTYSVKELKNIIKSYSYKLKLTGNKSQLISTIYSYLYLSNYAIKIQKIARGILQRKYNSSHGPAYINRTLCVNATDFLSMDNITDVSKEQFFSFKDEKGFIYGFDILSIFNLMMKTGGFWHRAKNPYNSKEFTPNIVRQLRLLMRLSKLMKINICTHIPDVTQGLTDKKTAELRTLTLFQNIDALGNYSDPNWFLSLSINRLKKFMHELIDIWEYRTQLTMIVKRDICPPLGNPFCINLSHLQSLENINEIRQKILLVLEKLVNSGIDRDSKCLGSYYVLCALTLVNNDAATSLPWLYQSVSYI